MSFDRSSKKPILLIGFICLVIGFTFWFFVKNKIYTQRIASREVLEPSLLVLSRYIEPVKINEEAGTFYFDCVLEKINFLNEPEYLTYEQFSITVTADCGYYNVSREKDFVILALMVENTVEQTTSLPGNNVLPLVIRPRTIEDFLKQITTADGSFPEKEIKAGSIVRVNFNTTNSINSVQYVAANHHGRWIDYLYSSDELIRFSETKNSKLLPNRLLIPMGVDRK